MSGRNKEYAEGKYRFGYNGMEMDNEVSGNGTAKLKTILNAK